MPFESIRFRFSITWTGSVFVQFHSSQLRSRFQCVRVNWAPAQCHLNTLGSGLISFESVWYAVPNLFETAQLRFNITRTCFNLGSMSFESVRFSVSNLFKPVQFWFNVTRARFGLWSMLFESVSFLVPTFWNGLGYRAQKTTETEPI